MLKKIAEYDRIYKYCAKQPRKGMVVFMINTDSLCFGCMNDNGGEKLCPICGYKAGTSNPDKCLPVKFLINNRYLIGRVISQNGAEITYIGWDNSSDAVVNIKEYFPDGCANRNPDKTVSMVSGDEYTFNEGLMEFAEINRIIMESELPSLVPVTDVFEENGTIYAIENSIQGITLESFLEKNGNTLKWEQARALFLPLIDTIKGMNDAGIIHRGISAETVMVGRDGKLRMKGYSIRKLRLLDTKIEKELYTGYAAVEQYGIEGLHDDNYTDVYGLCATLFRVLIGNPPPESRMRLNNDVMTIPAHFAEELPHHVLAALANGLQVLPEKRTKDIERFKNELVYGEIAGKEPQKRTRSNPVSKTEDTPQKKSGTAKYVLISMLCTALIFLVIATVLIFTVFKDQVFKPRDDMSSSEPASISAPVVESIGTVDSGAEVTAKLYSVPNLKGKYYAEIIDNNDWEMFDFTLAGKAYSDLPKGTVCEQSVVAGTDAVRDTKIELTISLGPKEIKIANLKGLDELNAKMELLKQGFLYDNIEVLEKYDEDSPSGVVLEQEPSYGSSVNTETTVKIWINSYVEEQTQPNTATGTNTVQ